MRAPRQAGFTLIEVIATLILMGILAAGLAVGLPQYVQGYLNMVSASSASLDMEVAAYRIFAELQEVTAITSASSSSISYDALFPGGAESSTLAYNDVAKTLNLTTAPSGGSSSTAVLLKDVSSFSVSLNEMSSGALTSATTADATLIQIDISFAPSGIATKSYTLRVAPAGLQ